MSRPSARAVRVSLLVAALLMAGVVSYVASSRPDGLQRVAEDQGFADTERSHETGDGPFAGYSSSFIEDGRLSSGFAGVVGVLVVLTLAGGLTLVLRRRRPDDDRA